MTLTGALTAFEICTASRTKWLSKTARRPKPPPNNVVWTLTCSGLSPAACAAAMRSTVWNCVPVQTSQRSGRTSATQLSGSIVA